MRISRRDLRSETLRRSARAFRDTGREAGEVAAALTEGQLWWRPEPDRWSIGECLDHLVLTGEAYLEALDHAIADGRSRGLVSDEPHRAGAVGRWLAALLEPPPRFGVPAPGRIRPRRPGPGHPDGSPLPRFQAPRGRLGERLEAAEGLDLRRIRVTSPFFRWLRFDLGSAFRIVAAHERRHLWQARRVREHERFPEA